LPEAPHATITVRASATNSHGTGEVTFTAIVGLNPNDLDNDGLPNDWETAHGLDPNNPSDAAADGDGDGLSTLTEYLAGSNPALNESSGPSFLATGMTVYTPFK
jgi:hypothetical protein